MLPYWSCAQCDFIFSPLPTRELCYDAASNLSSGLAYSCWPQISKSTGVFVPSCIPSACSNLYPSDYWKSASMLSSIHNISDIKVFDRVLRLALQENFDRSCPCWLFWGMLGYGGGISQCLRTLLLVINSLFTGSLATYVDAMLWKYYMVLGITSS